MRLAGKGAVALALLALAGPPAGAEGSWAVLLDCAATYSARIAYMQALDQAPPGHLDYLQTQSDFFLVSAQRLAPPEMVDCGDGTGPLLGLALCFGPASLLHGLSARTLDKLTARVERNGGKDPLPTCMEDAECAACGRLMAGKTPG